MIKYKKRLAAFLLSCALAVSTMTVSAVDTQNANNTAAPGTTELTEDELEKQMDEQYAILPESNSYKNWPQGPQVKADAAIVMDVNSGAVLYAKQIDKQEYPASITKVMTALLALENGDIKEDKVTFSENSVAFLESGDAQIGMRAGEEISLEDALYGMLLASANEVSYAVSESIGNKLGIGYDGFIKKMTERAKELGCENTNFVNANGLHDPNHYVSARDMALISAEAFKHEEFRTVIKSQEHTIGPTNLESESRVFQQNHKMIYPGNKYYYEYCQGGKTGYTDQARTTLVSYAEKDGMQLVCVILRSRGGIAYEETKSLFEYAYTNFKKQPLNGTETSSDIAGIPDDAYVVLPANASFSDLEMKLVQKEKGGTEASLEYTYEGQMMGKAAVTLSEKYINEQKTKDEAKDAAAQKKKEVKKGLPLWLKIVIGLVAAAAAVFAALLVIAVRRQQMKRRRRQQMRRKRMQQARQNAGNTQNMRNTQGTGSTRRRESDKRRPKRYD